LPGCVATGATREEAEKNMYEAIEMHIQGLLEDKLTLQSCNIYPVNHALHPYQHFLPGRYPLSIHNG